MFVFTNFLSAVAEIVDYILTLYMYIIIARALISWVNPDPYNSIVQFLNRITEPVLNPLRKLVPAYKLGLDLSPMIAILVIMFLKRFIVSTLIQISYR